MLGALEFEHVGGLGAEAVSALRPEGRLAKMSVSHVDGVVGLERYAATIDRLNAASMRPNPFLSAAFLRLYALRIEYFRPGDEERLYLVWRGDEVIGCLPMRRSPDNFRLFKRPVAALGRRLQFLAPLDTEQPGLLAAPEDEEVVAAALVRHLCTDEQGWGMLEFVGQQPHSALHRAVQSAADPRFRARDIRAAPYTEITLVWKDVRAYFQSLVKKMRSNVSRQARRLYAAGEPQLILANGAEATSAWFDAYCDVDARSWKGGGQASIARHPRRVRFFRDLAAGHGGFEPAFIGVVLDGLLIAGLVLGSNANAAQQRSGVWCFEMAFDRMRADLGPGQLLLLLAVAQAIEHQHTFVNFMQNFAYYKHRWAARSIDVLNVQLIRRVSTHNLSASLGDVRRKLRTQPDAVAVENLDYEGADEIRRTAASATPHDESRGRALTARALQYHGPGVRILDRVAAHGYLPFDIG